MAFYKKVKKKINGKWYPQAVLVGRRISTEQISKRLAAESTVSPADVIAVLTALGSVMADYMSQGHSVKLDGVGTFYLTATAAKNGVSNAKDVNADQIVGVRVRFLPETHYEGGRAKGKRVMSRTLTSMPIHWEEWKAAEEENKPKEDETPPKP